MTSPPASATRRTRPSRIRRAAQPASGEEIALRWRTRPDNQEEIDVYQNASDAIDAKLDGVTLTYEPGGSETSLATRMC